MNATKVLEEKIGRKIVEQLMNNKPPIIEIPKRFKTNVWFDEKDKVIRMKDDTFERQMNSLSGIKSFTQTLAVASVIADSLRQKISLTKRDVYYAGGRITIGKESLFEKQADSDLIIEDIEVLTGLFREQLGVVAEESGQIVGNIVYETLNRDGEWIETDCTKVSDPMQTSGRFIKDEEFKIKSIDAKFILIVEKGGILTKLFDTKFDKRHNCIMISTKGQPDRASRYLVKKIHNEYKLPVYMLVDGDPWGMHIASVWKYGSIRLCYENDRLACPNAKLIGVFPSEIEKYDIKKYEKLDEGDIRRARRLLSEPWLNCEPEWKKEIELFLKNNKKCEIENLSEHNIRFLTDTYLPEKLNLK